MRKLLQRLGAILIIVMSIGHVYADGPLPPGQAFKVTAEITGQNQVTASFQLAPNYFLYADKLTFTFDPAVSFTSQLPQAVSKHDDERGQVMVYKGDFAIPLQLAFQAASLHLEIAYQGCSSQGFCYPPTKQSFDLAVSSGAGAAPVTNAIVTNQSMSALLTDQYGVQKLLAEENRGWLLLVFLGLGILLAFTPCVLPMLPILTGIIAGQKQASTSRKAFLLSGCYVLGMAITYACAGMLAAFAGGSLQVWLQTPTIIIASSIVFVLLGFSLFEVYEFPISRHWQNAMSAWSRRHEGGTFIGVFFMGIISTLVVSPCVTAPLVGVLLYISRTGDMVLGGSALFAMGLGMGIPLMLLGVSAGRWLPKSGQWMHAITKSFGVVMFGMALWLLARIIPAGTMVVLWGLYLVAIALFFSFYLTRVIGRHKINHTLGFASGLVGLLMILSTIGMPALLNRWTGTISATAAVSGTDFVVVRNAAELADKLASAKTMRQPVLVDFYADWCTSCVEMEKEVFARQNVQTALQPFMLIRVDLSQNTAEDQKLMQQYGVVAPPSVLLFNAAGQEADSRRIVGELNANEFLNRINLFMAASCDTKAQC